MSHTFPGGVGVWVVKNYQTARLPRWVNKIRNNGRCIFWNFPGWVSMVICVIRPRPLLSLKSVKNCGTSGIFTLLSKQQATCSIRHSRCRMLQVACCFDMLPVAVWHVASTCCWCGRGLKGALKCQWWKYLHFKSDVGRFPNCEKYGYKIAFQKPGRKLAES